MITPNPSNAKLICFIIQPGRPNKATPINAPARKKKTYFHATSCQYNISWNALTSVLLILLMALSPFFTYPVSHSHQFLVFFPPIIPDSHPCHYSFPFSSIHEVEVHSFILPRLRFSQLEGDTVDGGCGLFFEINFPSGHRYSHIRYRVSPEITAPIIILSQKLTSILHTIYGFSSRHQTSQPFPTRFPPQLHHIQ